MMFAVGAGTFSFPCVEKEGEIYICTVTHSVLSYIIPAIAATGLVGHPRTELFRMQKA